jgi:hypothetical protein
VRKSYEGIFCQAKKSAVYSIALVHIKDILDDKNRTEEAKFLEVENIIKEAARHLEPK